jgi:hypothetical protein
VLSGGAVLAPHLVLTAGAKVNGQVVPARAQMAATLGFHIILACLGIALPTVVLLAEFIGLRRSDEVAPFGVEGLFSSLRRSSPGSISTGGGGWAAGRTGGVGHRSR